MNLPYEVTAAGMLIITLIFYNYKNWLDLRKNRIFRDILLAGSIFLAVDSFVEYLAGLSLQSGNIFYCISDVVKNFFGALIFYLFLLYDLAVVRRMRVQYLWRLKLLSAMIIVVSIARAVLSVMVCLVDESAVYIHAYKTIHYIQHGLFLICMLTGLWYLLTCTRILRKTERRVFFWCHIGIIAADILVATGYCNSGVLSYTLAFISIVYYMLLHNIDQYRFRSSGCFGRDGFNLVVKEKAHYKENFACLGICISNTESITNFCTQEEIKKLHHDFGKLLNQVCNRREVYHKHSFEYVIMTKNIAAAEKYHKILRQVIPSYVRMNDKNISLVCGFYVLDFADASFISRDFNRIQHSLRKLAQEQQNRDVLVRYQGERQKEIQQDLEALSVINNKIANHKYRISILPIQSTDAEGRISYELIPDEQLPDGTPISQEKIWEIMQEVGYSRDVNFRFFDSCCQYIKDKKLLDKNMDRIHINLAPFKLSGIDAAKQFVKIIEKYEIPFDKLCLEITIDQTVRYESLREGMMYLKKFGVSLLFDQFGVSVCNLKQALNLPFDAVKINHYIVCTYCDGRSKQLKYMINMLLANGWRIYLDGVNSETQLSILCDLDISYIQGNLVSAVLQNDKSDILFAQLGGRE